MSITLLVPFERDVEMNAMQEFPTLSFRNGRPPATRQLRGVRKHRREELSLDNAFALIEGHPAYLDEMCFRFNNRKNPYLFRDTIIKLISSPNLEYKDLTAKIEDAA